jgi:PKD repeat protein
MTFNATDTRLLVIDDGDGSNNLTVDSRANPFPVPIDVRGNRSTLTLTGGTAAQDVQTAGTAAGTGSSAIQIGGLTQTIAFAGVASVLDTVAGPLTVAGTTANDVINDGPGAVLGDGLVTVGGLAAIEFSNKTTLAIAAGPGDDTITVNDPATPTGLTAIAVDGGPGANILVVNALGNPVNSATAGTIGVESLPPVTYANIEQVQVLGAPDQPLTSTAAAIAGIAGTPLSDVLVGSFSDASTGARASDFTALVDWGDGTPATAGQVAAGGPGLFQVFGTHTYATAGTRTVLVTVADSGGASSLIAAGVTLTVNDQGGSTAPIASQATIIPAPLEPQAQPVFGIVGMPIAPGTLVATFVTTPGSAAAGKLAAQVDSGNGAVDAVVSPVPGSATSFQVTTAGPLTFSAPGTFPIRVTIEDHSGNPTSAAVAIATATIGPAPLASLSTAPLTATAQTPLVAATVGSLTDLNPLASPANHSATIDWGDGSPSSVGTIIQPGGPGTPLVVLGNHTYAEPGLFRVTTTVQALGGMLLTLANTAQVAGLPIVLTGQLDPSSDTGASNSDGITRDDQPRFTGSSSPFSIIRLFASPAAGGNAVLLGQTAADAGGAWQITSSLLADGSYIVFATALDPSGHNPTETTILPAAHPLVVDTVGPTVTGVVIDRARGQVAITFQDDRSGLDQAALRNPVSYIVTTPRSAASGALRVTRVTLLGAASPTAPVKAVLTLSGGRPLPSATYTVTVRSARGTLRIRDLAGNALDGEFAGTFPSGDGTPGGNFVARLDSVSHRVLAAAPARVLAAAAMRPGLKGHLAGHRQP